MCDFNLLLQELDTRLKEINTTIEITVIGAYALILHGILRRYTVDIDTISEIKDQNVLNIIHDIGLKYGVPGWLNDNAENIILPDNYKNRLKRTLDYSNIIIYYVSRIDLIFLKVAAYFYRHEYELKDLSDLKALRPSKNEMKAALDFLLAKHKPESEKFVRVFNDGVKTIGKTLLEICNE